MTSDAPTTQRVSEEPPWVRHAVWWHVYPLGFTGADATGSDQAAGRRLRHLVDWLDYAVRLGVSGLALGPIFASSTHGYDTTDHYRIDPRLGDDDDFRRLVEAAHERGLRVLLDGVFNHVGREFPAFEQTLSLGHDAPRADWFRLVAPGPGSSDDEPTYATFEGHQGLVELDHENPAVADYVVDVMDHWLARGADGWRLDAAYSVPVKFWTEVVGRIRERHPQSYLVGEMIHGDYSAFVAATGLHAVTQYELWKAIWSSLNDGNFFELAWALERHNAYLETFAPLTFIGNHDVTRIATALDDHRHLGHAMVVLATVGGTPSVYYGDEQGLTGRKEARVGGDDAIRPAFPARPDDLDTGGDEQYRLYQQLIGLRRRHPWLHRARTATVTLTNRQLSYDVTDGVHTLRVHLNVGDDPFRPVASPGATLASSTTHGQPDDLVVAPHGWAITEP